MDSGGWWPFLIDQNCQDRKSLNAFKTTALVFFILPDRQLEQATLPPLTLTAPTADSYNGDSREAIEGVCHYLVNYECIGALLGV